MQSLMGKKKKSRSKNIANSQTDHQQNSKKSHCRALCCGSRLSVSSTTSCSEPIRSSDTELINDLSNMAHGMVQARLEHIIGENSHPLGFHERHRRDLSFGKTYCNKSVSNANTTTDSKKYVVLVAIERDSYDPREDFRNSIMEVITCKGLVEPKELKGLLNCYVSLNSSEHHQPILEAFVDVCSALFVCKKGNYVH